ncbi:MAG TPA: SusD/RagB family nutrient-binding outer membrane lipoprotein [Arachidicoccus sp.]|nr:SusD/RagB family nutrient-binding outer membrane lipoprotein [Arachidicoccus sp.]
MKKLLIALTIIASIATYSCSKDFGTLNKNTKLPETATGEAEFSNAQKEYVDLMATPNVNTNIFELITQYWAETQYPQESQYELTERNIARNWWSTLYRNVIANTQDAIKLIKTEVTPLPADVKVQSNKVAICQILYAKAYSDLVVTFGDIPYTDAISIEQTSTPKYDNQKTVYYAIIDTLNKALSTLDIDYEAMGTQDLFYNGDVAKWIKLGNSIKMYLGLLIYDVDPAKATAMVKEASAKAFESNEDNTILHYLPAPPNTNPIWVNLVQGGRDDFIPTNTLVNLMNGLNDPRRDIYFANKIGGKYVGGVSGTGNTYKNFSHPGDGLKEPTYPFTIFDYAQVEFLRAEAIERGIAVGGTAAGHYSNAVTASILAWGGSSAQATTYLLQPSVNYLTATGNWKQKIGTQSWIHFYLRGFDSWTQQRKLDFPKLIVPELAVSGYPVRYTYPQNEYTLNEANVTEASANLGSGGDKVETKLFWDKN